MGASVCHNQPQELQLEVIEINEEESDHSKLMKAYERLHQKINDLVERRKSTHK